MIKKTVLKSLLVVFPLVMIGLFTWTKLSIEEVQTEKNYYVYSIKKGFEEEIKKEMEYLPDALLLTKEEMKRWSDDPRMTIDPQPREQYIFKFAQGYEEEMKKELGLPNDFKIPTDQFFNVESIYLTKKEYRKYKKDKRIIFSGPLSEAT